MTQPGRHKALERLDIFAGEWALEASFPGDTPTAVQEPAAPRRDRGEPGSGVYSMFEWALDGRFLIQRTEVRLPGGPDSLAIVAFDPGKGAYTQHYFDSRGIARLYAMSFAEGTWELLRDSPDFSPLDFSQRFTGTFSDDGDTIRAHGRRPSMARTGSTTSISPTGESSNVRTFLAVTAHVRARPQEF